VAHNFWIFVSEIFGHWLALVTGSVVSLFILVKEHRNDRSVRWRVIVGIFLVGLAVLVFFAWQDEYLSAGWRGGEILAVEQELRDAQLKNTPDFVPEIYNIATATGPVDSWRGTSLVFVIVNISNRGADSGVEHFTMTLKLDDGETLEGVQPPPVGKINIPTTEFTSAEVGPDEYLPFKGSRAICRGCLISGWFWSGFPSVPDITALWDHATLILRFKDIMTGHLYSVEKRFGGFNRIKQPPHTKSRMAPTR
jgi:hypothetical protein